MHEIRKILVPVDFSKHSQKLIQFASDIAEKFQATVTVLFVSERFTEYEEFPIPHISLAEFENEMAETARKKMAKILEDEAGKKPGLSTQVLAGDVVEEIVGYAKKEAMDMIIMGTHGYKGIEKIFLGSVAERVVGRAPCPVLTWNPYR